MPLLGDYTWSEKKDSIILVIPLKGINPSKVDILVTPSTLKVNYNPYLIDIILHNKINPVRNKAKVKDGNLQITLFKSVECVGKWGKLEMDITDETTVAVTKRESHIAQEDIQKELDEKRKSRQIDDERFALRKQMALDEAERNYLEGLKEEEKRNAETEIYKAFSKMKSDEMKKMEEKTSNRVCIAENGGAVHLDRESGRTLPMLVAKPGSSPTQAPTTNSQASNNIFEVEDVVVVDNADFDAPLKSSDDLMDDRKDFDECLEDTNIKPTVFENVTTAEDFQRMPEAEIKYTPPPRSLGISKATENKVDLQFTPRVFPTPMRESKVAEEEDWIAKNRRHLKKHGVLGSQLRKGNGIDPTEEDPQWLKAKGDDFYRTGDFRSAINAYSAAIDADEYMTSCYANRSACYFQLGMLEECKMDCSDAIKQLQPDEGNSSAVEVGKKVALTGSSIVMMLKLLVRRGATNCQLGIFRDALADYRLALDTLSTQESIGHSPIPETISKTALIEDVSRLEKLVLADSLKKDADRIFADNLVEEAIAKYSEALEVIPVHVGCLSNRAACKMAAKDFIGCVHDCSAALAQLQASVQPSQRGFNQSGGVSMLSSILPPIGSEKRKSWVLKTILRRGAAYAQLGRLDEAIEDYKTASGLDPENASLKSDLNKIVNLREGAKKTSSV